MSSCCDLRKIFNLSFPTVLTLIEVDIVGYGWLLTRLLGFKHCWIWIEFKFWLSRNETEDDFFSCFLYPGSSIPFIRITRRIVLLPNWFIPIIEDRERKIRVSWKFSTLILHCFGGNKNTNNLHDRDIASWWTTVLRSSDFWTGSPFLNHNAPSISREEMYWYSIGYPVLCDHAWWSLSHTSLIVYRHNGGGFCNITLT